MWNSVEVNNICSENGGYKLHGQNLTNALKNHFCNSLVGFSSPGVASILTFRKSCHFRFQNSNDIDDKDVKELAERIKTETKRTDKTRYKIQFDSKTMCDDTVTH